MFSIRSHGELTWLQADRTGDGFVHGFSTRRGGVSDGVYTSLNLGFSSDDATANVETNWRRWLGALGVPGFPVVFARQVHGASLHRGRLARVESFFHCVGEGDALWTNDAGLALAVVTADCVPVVVAGRGAEPFVAAIHAGWRGLADGIIRRTIADIAGHVSFDPKDLHVLAGPHIGSCCYEVGSEAARRLAVCVPGGDEAVVPDTGGKSHVSLGELVRLQARASGVPDEQILICAMCTCCHEDNFFSYRRARGTERGRMAAVIAMRSVT